jgi:hypothetical protein
MSTRVEILDPVPFAGIASEILQAASHAIETAAALNLEVV